MKTYLALLLFQLSLSVQVIPKKAQPNRLEPPRLTVVVFLAVDCPISQKYVGELNRIDTLFGTKVYLRGVVPGKIQDSEIREFISAFHITFHVEPDRNFSLVKKYQARVTPEAFLIDDKGHVYYQGAIDNWFFDLGKNRQEITETYLLNAIHQVLEGRDVVQEKTEAVGCFIQVPRK